ncbi:hypothetical protein DL767_009790 [Monosporascus sp. MG133]|nr:hypothetical protein DL767_009790 [Monosporascus sp. MG133]
MLDTTEGRLTTVLPVQKLEEELPKGFEWNIAIVRDSALENLRDGKGRKASAVKYVFRIADTEGASQDKV